MKNLYALPALLLAACLGACTLLDGSGEVEDRTTGDAMLQVDLQYGLEGHRVTLQFNDEAPIDTTLSASVPFSGPLDTLVFHLPRGENHLWVRWFSTAPPIGPVSPLEGEINLQIEHTGPYYLGLGVASDTLVTTLQETPFLYQ